MRSGLQALSLAMLMAAGWVQAGDFRVGVVDTERVLRESAPAVKAEQRIEKEFSARDAEIKAMIKQAKEMQASLEKDSPKLSDVDHRNKERELTSLNVNIQRMQREFREDLNLRKNEELAAVLDKANKAIQQIAASDRYDLILQEAVYRNPKIDITDKVINFLANDAAESTSGKDEKDKKEAK